MPIVNLALLFACGGPADSLSGQEILSADPAEQAAATSATTADEAADAAANSNAAASGGDDDDDDDKDGDDDDDKDGDDDDDDKDGDDDDDDDKDGDDDDDDDKDGDDDDDDKDECVDLGLGSASGYNVYTIGDFTGNGSDIGGRIAVGGNFDADSYGLASALPAGSGVVLSVGGDADIVNSQIYGGDGQVAGSCTTSGLGVPFGMLYCDEPSTFDAGATEAEMQGIADSLAGLAAANCTVTPYAWGAVDIDVTGSPAVCDFDIDALAAAFDPWVTEINGITINGPVGATVIVNVSGNTDLWGKNGGFFLGGGVSVNGILWNFDDAAWLTVSNVGVAGTIFAPSAHVDFNNGNVDGGVVAGSIAGTGEFHDYTFDGEVCVDEGDDDDYGDDDDDKDCDTGVDQP